MPSRKSESASLNPAVSRGIISILLFVLALIITLSFVDRAGALGVMIDEFLLSFLFGKLRFFVPALLIASAWVLLRGETDRYRLVHLLGFLLILLSLAGMFHLGFDPITMWQEALNGAGGGVFGMIGYPLKLYGGTIASIIVLVALLLIGAMLLFDRASAMLLTAEQALSDRLRGLLPNVSMKTRKFLTGNSAEDTGEYDDDEQDEEEEDELEKRGFHVRQMNESEENDDKDEEVEEDFDKQVLNDEDADKNEKREAEDSAIPYWQQHLVVRDLPPLSLLSNKRGKPTSGDIESNAATIHNTLSEFGIEVDMGEIRVGPTVTQYSLKPASGVKLSRITNLSNDLALALAAHPIRIEAPIPGKALVGIEVPNEKTALVSIKELLEGDEFEKRAHHMMIALGRDVAGKVWFADLPRMPHLLVAGATGSGKTVCINTIIMSLLYQNTAETLRMIMVDPKRVELTMYNGIPHLLTPVITNTAQTINALKWTIAEMERRFELLSQAGNRDIATFNKGAPQKLPYIIFVIDELADLMATAAADVEGGIIRLAQMARAVGIHLILATQRPSVDVITGLMKANIPGRIAFSVASLTDSRTILDTGGAEKLLGRGDMLFSTAEFSKPIRIQGAYISEDETRKVVTYLKGNGEPVYDESIVNKQAAGGTMNMFGGPSDDQDPLFEEAKTLILESGKASASLLQRRMKVGYARAARILDELEDAQIIGPADGAKPREILMTEQEIVQNTRPITVFSKPKPVVEEVEEAVEEEEFDEDGLITDEEEAEKESDKTDEADFIEETGEEMKEDEKPEDKKSNFWY